MGSACVGQRWYGGPRFGSYLQQHQTDDTHCVFSSPDILVGKGKYLVSNIKGCARQACAGMVPPTKRTKANATGLISDPCEKAQRSISPEESVRR